MEEVQDVRWTKLADQMQAFHPNGAAAVQAAEGAGLNPADFSGALFSGPPLATGPYPVLYFGDWQSGGGYHTVQPGNVGVYTPVARGKGAVVIEGKRS